jgi:DNA-binding beta-propeller fold protein YncE
MIEEIHMRRSSSFLRNSVTPMLAACALFVAGGASAQEFVINAPQLGERFITFPPGVKYPESVTADPVSGSLFSGTDNLQPGGSGANFLLRYDMTGRLLAELPVGGISVTGIAYNPRDQKLYFARPGAIIGLESVIQRVAANFDAYSVIETIARIPDIPAPENRTQTTFDGKQISIPFADSVPIPKGVAFRASDGALFVTDSLQFAVFKINNPVVASNTCKDDTACVQLVKQDPLLASPGPFGVDGLVFSADESTLYLTNNGDARLLSMRLSDNQLAVMTNSIQGADGIQLGPDHTLIISRAGENSLAVLDGVTGRIVGNLGAFRGIRSDGSVRGLLFPGSFTVVDNVLFANNLALPITHLPSEAAGDVRTYTMSRMVLPSEFPR